jgi:DNA-binding beta-propeller fold protein YncE
VTTLAGSGKKGSNDGSKANASFKYPQGVAVDRDGKVFVADTGNSLIREIQ